VVLTDNILGKDNKNYQTASFVSKIGDTELSINHKTQDKVDLVLEYNNKPINISLKNYKASTVNKHGVGLLSGANLLVYL
jgi:hypothetical protein